MLKLQHLHVSLLTFYVFFECVFVMIQVAILLQKLNVPEKQHIHTILAANVVKKFFQQIKKEYKLQSTAF